MDELDYEELQARKNRKDFRFIEEDADELINTRPVNPDNIIDTSSKKEEKKEEVEPKEEQPVSIDEINTGVAKQEELKISDLKVVTDGRNYDKLTKYRERKEILRDFEKKGIKKKFRGDSSLMKSIKCAAYELEVVIDTPISMDEKSIRANIGKLKLAYEKIVKLCTNYEDVNFEKSGGEGKARARYDLVRELKKVSAHEKDNLEKAAEKYRRDNKDVKNLYGWNEIIKIARSYQEIKDYDNSEENDIIFEDENKNERFCDADVEKKNSVVATARVAEYLGTSNVFLKRKYSLGNDGNIHTKAETVKNRKNDYITYQKYVEAYNAEDINVIYTDETIKKLQTIRVIEELMGVKIDAEDIIIKPKSIKGKDSSKMDMLIENIMVELKSRDYAIKNMSQSRKLGIVIDRALADNILAADEEIMSSLFYDVMDIDKVKILRSNLKNMKARINNKSTKIIGDNDWFDVGKNVIENEKNKLLAANNTGFATDELLKKYTVENLQRTKSKAPVKSTVNMELGSTLINSFKSKKATDEELDKMKNILKDVKRNSIVQGELSIDRMMEWATCSATVDGASDEFTAIIDAMKGISEVFGEYARTWKIYDAAMENKASKEELEKARIENDAATVKCHEKYYKLALNARKYVKSHDGHKWSDKGHNRLAFAKYILSGDFMKKYVIKFSTTQLYGAEYPNQLDADSFIMAYELQQDGRKVQDAIYDDVFYKKGKVRERLNGFKMGDVNRLQARVLYDTDKLMASDEARKAEKAKVSNAMMSYIGKKVVGVKKDGNDVVENVAVNKEPLFKILDSAVEEVCKFKITEDLFKKSHYVEHPEDLHKIRRLSQLLGDCLDEDSEKAALGECGKEYLNLIKNSPAYTKFYAKLTLITFIWSELIDFMATAVGIRVETISGEAVRSGEIITHECFSPALGEDYDEEYEKYNEELNREPEDWLKSAVDDAKAGWNVTDEMKRFIGKSVFSSIRVPRRIS